MVPRARHSGLDEDDVRVRAGRGSRPRTRRRPAHTEAVDAFVAAVDRGRYRCVTDDEVVTAMKARELGRGMIVVGDTVSLAGDASGALGTLARIVRIAPRRTVLRRSADDTDPVERAIVANADQLVIVCALANPPPRLRLIDRFLVAAYDAGLEPALCLTKADLAGPEAILAVYAPLGFRYVVLGRPLTDSMLADLRGLLAGRVSVLVGHSGVGKSTLVNALIPEADRAVGAVSPVTGRGRHTSSSAVAFPLRGDPGGRPPEPAPAAGAGGRPPEPGLPGDPAGSPPEPAPPGEVDGWIIDTPGLRSFGLGHMSPERVVQAFADLAEGAEHCPPGCDHLGPECALDDWVDARGGGPSLGARLDSLRRLLRSREGLDTDER